MNAIEHPQKAWRKRMQSFSKQHHHHGDELSDASKAQKAPKPEKRGPALAYQFGNTIIVEDEDGEVIKQYDIPSNKKEKEKRPGAQRGQSVAEGTSRAIQSLKRMGTQLGVPAAAMGESAPSGTQAADGKKKKESPADDDDRLRFTVTAGGRRMSKMEFITQMSQMDPKARAKFVQSSDAPEAVKTAAHEDAKEQKATDRRKAASATANVPPVVGEEGEAEIHKIESPAAHEEDRVRGPEGLTLVDSRGEDVPFHSVHTDLQNYSMDQQGETGAQRRRRLAAQESDTAPHHEAGNEDPDQETPAERRRRLGALKGSSSPPSTPNRQQFTSSSSKPADNAALEGETAAERKRRLGALGVGDDSPESDSDDEVEAGDPMETGRGTHPHASDSKKTATNPATRTPGIRFAEQPRIPTKDERLANDAQEKEAREGEKKKTGLVGKLFKK